MRKPKKFVPMEITKDTRYWIIPAIMYFSAFVTPICSYLFKKNYQVKSMDGHAWWTQDIYGSSVLLCLWTLLPIVLYTIYKVRKDNKIEKYDNL